MLSIGPFVFREHQGESQPIVKLRKLGSYCEACVDTSSEALQLCHLSSCELGRPILAMSSVSATVWSLTSDLVLAEWELQQSAEMTGLRPDKRQITALRRIQIGEPSAAPVDMGPMTAQIVRVGLDTLWCLYHKTIVAVNIASSLPSLLGSHEVLKSPLAACCGFPTPHSFQVWTADDQGSVMVWEVHAKEKQPVLRRSFKLQAPALSLQAFPSSDQVWAGLATSQFAHFSISSARFRESLSSPTPIYSIFHHRLSSLDPNHLRLWTFARDGRLAFWEL